MSKFKDTMHTLGKVADAIYERNQQLDNMTNELVRRGSGIDVTQARKIAKILIDQADVTWKR